MFSQELIARRKFSLLNVDEAERRIKTQLVYAWKDYRYFLFSFVNLLFSKFPAINYLQTEKKKKTTAILEGVKRNHYSI